VILAFKTCDRINFECFVLRVVTTVSEERTASNFMVNLKLYLHRRENFKSLNVLFYSIRLSWV
jgi:hypothetical protein